MTRSIRANPEGAIQKALEDLRTHKFSTVSVSARAHGVLISTLYHRYKGCPDHVTAHSSCQLLTPTEEKVITKWIQHQCHQGFPPFYDILVDMAVTVLRARNPSSKTPYVGAHWPQWFLLHHKALRTMHVQTLAQNWQLGTSHSIISQWFDNFAELMKKYDIKKANMWNMNEKRFVMGLSRSQKMIVTVNSPKFFLMKPGNQTWVSILECISAHGQALASFLIWKEKWHQKEWYRMYSPEKWMYAVSEKSWTDNDLEFEWLIKHFNPLTWSSTNEWWMLLLDSHSSHITWQFQYYCLQNQILLIVLPLHTTHWTQPLNVSVFEPLEHWYVKKMKSAFCMNLDIMKQKFIELYERARTLTLDQNNIIGAWKGAGLHPLDPKKILSKLLSEHPITPSENSSVKQSYIKTSMMSSQLQNSMNSVLKRQFKLTLTSQMQINKILKAFKQAMIQNLFLEQKVQHLQKTNQKKSSHSRGGQSIKGVERIIMSEQASQTLMKKKNTKKAVTKLPTWSQKISAKHNGTMEQALVLYCSVLKF